MIGPSLNTNPTADTFPYADGGETFGVCEVSETLFRSLRLLLSLRDFPHLNCADFIVLYFNIYVPAWGGLGSVVK